MANVGWQFTTKVVTTLLALAAAGFVARRLGPEGLGLYRNTLALAGLLASFGLLVSQQVLIQRMLRFPEREGQYLGTAMRIVGGAGLVVLAVAMAVPWQFDGTNARWMVVAAASYFLVFFMVPMAAWFESRMEGRMLAMSNMAGLLLTRSWEIGCSILGAGVLVFAFSQSLGLILMSVIVAFIFIRRRKASLKLSWNSGVARDLIFASLPWAGLGIVNHAQLRSELFILTYLKGAAAGGQYSAASELMQPLLVVPGFLMSSLFPSVIRSYASDHALGQARMVQYVRLSAALGIGCSLGLALFGPTLAHLVYGSRFDAVAHLIRIIAWYVVPAFLAAPCVAWMVNENLGWLAAVYSVAGLVITVCLDLLLIPPFGVVGAAVASPLAGLVIGAVVPLCHPRTRWLAFTQWRALVWPVPDLHAIVPVKTSPEQKNGD